MRRVSEEGEASRKNAANDLHKHEPANKGEGKNQALLAGPTQVMGVVMAAVPMVVPVSPVSMVVARVVVLVMGVVMLMVVGMVMLVMGVVVLVVGVALVVVGVVLVVGVVMLVVGVVVALVLVVGSGRCSVVTTFPLRAMPYVRQVVA